MRKFSCTRMELLARKAKLELAEQGRDLLEKKRSALLKEFLEVADKVMEHADILQHVAFLAREALARAEAVVGPEAIRSAAIASRAELPLQISTVSLMGVKVPRIEQKRVSRSMIDRGYAIVGTSIVIDEAAEAFENEVNEILQLAENELRLVRLADEIQRTSRRLNALDHLLIPRLKAELVYIQTTLDEHERSDHFRLKLVKRILERRQLAMQGAD
ncbi:MAG: V-type ATP synthase subunit D [Chloroflexota bacterium]|nr:V-type ATP synthase subunit D [Chloroflexota bacterium]